MPIKFTCPSCNKNIKSKDEHAGRTVRCPNCKNPLMIPMSENVGGGQSDVTESTKNHKTMPNHNYFYTDTNGQRHGPIDAQQLRTLAAQGIITPKTPMETESGHKGVAGQIQIPGLFPPAAQSPFTQTDQAASLPATKQLYCTNCGNVVSSQAVACMSCGAKPVGHKKFCRQCAAPLTPEQVLCTKCGKQVSKQVFSAITQPLREKWNAAKLILIEKSKVLEEKWNATKTVVVANDQMDVVCSNIVYSVADHATGEPVTLLNDISLRIKPNEFACIIGPSGSGKTTLLNILSGRNKSTQGQVTIGGIDLLQNFDALKTMIAFVPQHEVLYEALSTKAGLTYTAKLRLPPETAPLQVREVVNQTIQAVGLTDRASTRIANLSGGQRKRACLGNEILSKPNVLFLDEVTSGLDEHSDREVMLLLKDMATSGKTVIMVTHNLPNIEETCDKIVVLTKQGYLAFCGTPQKAKEYFGIDSLGRIYEALEKESPLNWMQKFRNHSLSHAGTVPQETLCPQSQEAPHSGVQSGYNVINKENLDTFVRQVKILLDRRLCIQRCDTRSLIAIGGQCLIVSLLVSFLFGNVNEITDQAKQVSAQGSIVFLMVVSCLWFGCNNTAKEIVSERNIYLRERDVNLFPSSYLFSKLLFFGAIGSIQATVLFGIVCYHTRIDISILGGWITMLLLTFLGTVIGLCISIFSKSENFAAALVPIIIIPQIILAGCVYNVEGSLEIFSSLFIPAYWGYGGAGSLLNLDETAKTMTNLDGWTFASSFFMLIFQCCVLMGVSIWRLVSETTTLNIWGQGKVVVSYMASLAKRKYHS